MRAFSTSPALARMTTKMMRNEAMRDTIQAVAFVAVYLVLLAVAFASMGPCDPPAVASVAVREGSR